MKGESSFTTLSHVIPTQAETQQREFRADLAPVVAAIERLAAMPRQEIRVDLPAMNPSFNQTPVVVNVPDFPEVRMPPIAITVPDFKPVQLELSYSRLALVACVPPTVYVALQWVILWISGALS